MAYKEVAEQGIEAAVNAYSAAIGKNLRVRMN